MGVVCVLEEHRDVDIARLANSVDKVVVKEKKKNQADRDVHSQNLGSQSAIHPELNCSEVGSLCVVVGPGASKNPKRRPCTVAAAGVYSSLRSRYTLSPRQ
jgi:hypothetical protein